MVKGGPSARAATPRLARAVPDPSPAGAQGLVHTRTFNVLFLEIYRGVSLNIKDGRVYDITKEYTNMFRVTSYKFGYDPEALARRNEKKKKQKTNIPTEDSLQRSVRRSRTMINDYVKCNQFDIFVTFTFDPKKVDRYDLWATYMKMQGWLHRQSRKYEDFKYLIVPERHKDGAIHFHALIGGFPEEKLKKTAVIQNNRRVYNVTAFRFGFTNAQYLDEDVAKTTAYLCKYITKDMELISNRRRYWSSKNLRKPRKYYNHVYDLSLQSELTPTNVVYENEYNTVYEFDKSLTYKVLFD